MPRIHGELIRVCMPLTSYTYTNTMSDHGGKARTYHCPRLTVTFVFTVSRLILYIIQACIFIYVYRIIVYPRDRGLIRKGAPV
jgi:hypothetical protein